jgi:hypothetical protein
MLAMLGDVCPALVGVHPDRGSPAFATEAAYQLACGRGDGESDIEYIGRVGGAAQFYAAVCIHRPDAIQSPQFRPQLAIQRHDGVDTAAAFRLVSRLVNLEPRAHSLIVVQNVLAVRPELKCFAVCL